jgi:hypothetical protein
MTIAITAGTRLAFAAPRLLAPTGERSIPAMVAARGT